MRRGPGISSPPSCRSLNGPAAQNTQNPDHAPKHRFLDRDTGDAAGARDQYAAVLPVRERVLGPQHPRPFTRANLAEQTAEAGDAAGARDQYAALVAGPERIQGPDHPDTLPTRHNFAYRTGEAGDMAGARDQFAALLRPKNTSKAPSTPAP